MSFLGKLFGSSDAVNTMVTGVRDGLDALVYTDEEKSNDARAERSEARAMLIEWMRATSGQNLARRFLAVVITFTWLIQYLSVIVLNIISVWAQDPKLWSQSAAMVGSNAESMNGAMMLILGFYFAAPHMGKIADAALMKFGGKRNKEISDASKKAE